MSQRDHFGLIGPIFSWGGIVLATVSFAKLIQIGVDGGWSDAFRALIGTYDWFTNLALGWLTTPLEQIAAFILRKVHVELGDHWKDFFIVISLYIGSTIKIHGTGLTRIKTILLVLGLFVALSGAIACGLVQLTGSPKDELMLSVSAIGSMSFYTIARGVFAAFMNTRQPGVTRRKQLYWNIVQKREILISGLTIVGLCFILSRFTSIEISFGLLSAILFYAIVSFIWLYKAYRTRNIRVPGAGSAWSKFFTLRNGDFRLAFYMLTALAGGLVLVAANAGLNAIS